MNICFSCIDIVLLLKITFINEPVSNKRYKLACVPIEDSDQPLHPCSLIRVFDERSMDSQGSGVSSGEKLRL